MVLKLFLTPNSELLGHTLDPLRESSLLRSRTAKQTRKNAHSEKLSHSLESAQR